MAACVAKIVMITQNFKKMLDSAGSFEYIQSATAARRDSQVA